MTNLTMKQKTLIVLCTLIGVVAIVVSTVFATVAYLTSSAAVSNVFTIGDVGITMTESKVDSNGVMTDGGATQVDTNTYHLVPGKTYTKDPRVTVDANSENSYLFVLVRNDIEAIEDTSKSTIAKQLNDNGWAKYIKAATGWVYVYVGFSEQEVEGVPTLVSNAPDFAEEQNREATYKYIFDGDDADTIPDVTFVRGGESYTLFEEFSIGNVGDNEIGKYGAAKITLTAVAIQETANFVNGVHDAWAAVIETYPYIHTGTNS